MEKQKVKQSTDDLILEMCRLMKAGNIRICIHSEGCGQRVEWNDRFVTEQREATARLQDLFYRVEDTTALISRLDDGWYGPVELWHKFIN